MHVVEASLSTLPPLAIAAVVLLIIGLESMGIPLPGEPFPSDELVEVEIGKTPYARFDLNDYSLPHDRTQRTLAVSASLEVVRVLDGTEVLATHPVSVTEVRMSPDLRHATVFVKPLLGKDEEAVLKALRTNTAYLQREVAHRIRMKYAAKLKFLADESFDEASHIDKLLRDPKVLRDLEGGEAEQS